ncbi:MAG: shikimate dehydrogenase, partial [Actinomycetota bacterium]|nr:shikimate dehydrogenase [Actinomycetota bacterium]
MNRNRLAVLGSPISHSKSPLLHRAAYAALSLDWQYEAVEVTGATLPGFLASRDESWRGLSLTMPLKRDVLPLLDE